MFGYGMILAALWGTCLAAFVRWTRLGKWLADRMTWVLVIIGAVGNALILLALTDEQGRIYLWQMASINAISLVAVSIEQIVELYEYMKEMMTDAYPDEISE